MSIVCDVIESPVGSLLLAAGDAGVTRLAFESPDGTHSAAPEWTQSTRGGGSAERHLAAARAQLAEYFSGERQRFDLPLAPRGTPFQLRVWRALQEIPFGRTMSYGELARRLGSPTAMRAVGGANARNPIAVIVPCHRVIGANGALTGFGGGMQRKRWLLEHEGVLPAMQDLHL
jgi:methylated-DNA-[protein]-cysteine S-methyltransferase